MSATPFDLVPVGACPSCRAALNLADRAYVCRGCARRWPIVAGIPRFVSSEQYVGSFGYQWQRHSRTQIDSKQQRESERTFAEKTGLTPGDVRGKLVLDVGLGTGRFADVVARWGGVPVGVDLSLAVVSARRNLERYYPHAFVAQADLFRLPFREESFDIVYSIGVLHHTPSTREALRAIARFVKPGGVLAVAVYDACIKEQPDFFSDWYRYSRRYRRYTRAMSNSFLNLLSHAAVPRQHVVDALGPSLGGYVKIAVPMSDHKTPAWRVLDTFDWYSPHFQWLHEEPEVRRWFEELGLENVKRLPERTMVSVRGERPGAAPLRTPPPSEEQRLGEVAPLPGWVPSSGTLRDLTLFALLLREIAAVSFEVLPAVLHAVANRVGLLSGRGVAGVPQDVEREGNARRVTPQ